MYELNIEGHFDSAHFLREYKGPCSNLHGHTWKYRVKLSSSFLDELGMLVDFKEVKRIMEQFDHKCINEHEPYTKINPTAENLARNFCNQISKEFFKKHIKVLEVVIYESDKCSASYKPVYKAYSSEW